jgi:hypothetical protein
MTILTVAVCVMALATLAQTVFQLLSMRSAEIQRTKANAIQEKYISTIVGLSEQRTPPSRRGGFVPAGASLADAIRQAVSDVVGDDAEVTLEPVGEFDVMTGRYGIEPCNGHWHVVDPDGDRVGGMYLTEAAAREVSDMLNALTSNAASSS